MNVRRGLLAGVALELIGLVGPPAGIALFLSEAAMFFLPMFAAAVMLIWWRNRSGTNL